MGNWRTVNMTGTIDPAEAAELVDYLTWDQNTDPHGLGPLTISSAIFALGRWPAAAVDAHGNLFERDYTPQDVADQLHLLTGVAPSMDLVVHCGGEYEDLECVATITVKGGRVKLWPPQVKTVQGMTKDEIVAAALQFL